MQNDTLARRIADWFEENRRAGFYYDETTPGDLSDVCLDGFYDLNALAEFISKVEAD